MQFMGQLLGTQSCRPRRQCVCWQNKLNSTMSISCSSCRPIRRRTPYIENSHAQCIALHCIVVRPFAHAVANWRLGIQPILTNVSVSTRMETQMLARVCVSVCVTDCTNDVLRVYRKVLTSGKIKIELIAFVARKAPVLNECGPQPSQWDHWDLIDDSLCSCVGDCVCVCRCFELVLLVIDRIVLNTIYYVQQKTSMIRTIFGRFIKVFEV